MTDEQRMLSDMADELFASLGHGASIENDWSSIEQVALDGLLLAEDAGGFGGSWGDALLVFRQAGYHALALPVAEAAIAASLARRGQERGTIANAAQGELTGGRFTGTVSGICYGCGASFIVAPCPQGGSMIFDANEIRLEQNDSLAGEPRESAALDGVAVTTVDGDVFMMGALARVAQIAGALDAALGRSVEYANERIQFGRALSKFQAVQQNLATFACEAAAANYAAMGAAQAMSKRASPFEIGAAKLRANRAVGIGTAVAHQVHGAIGFTEEYPLHPLTRRLWSWRSEFGNDSFWSDVLAPRIIERGADNFWADLTALSD